MKKIILYAAACTTISLFSQQAQAADTVHLTGEVFTTAGSFCPRHTAEVSGQALPTSQYSGEYGLAEMLGDAFNPGGASGGNSSAAFFLPDLRGRTPHHYGMAPGGETNMRGDKGGAEHVSVDTSMPTHSHSIPKHDHNYQGHAHTATLGTHTGNGDTNTPVDSSFASYPVGQNRYASGAPDGGDIASNNLFLFHKAGAQTTPSQDGETGSFGSGQQVDVRQPYVALKYCITLKGRDTIRP